MQQKKPEWIVISLIWPKSKQKERERTLDRSFQKLCFCKKKKKKVIKRCPLNVWEFITMLLLKVVYNLFWIDLPNLLFFLLSLSNVEGGGILEYNLILAFYCLLAQLKCVLQEKECYR